MLKSLDAKVFPFDATNAASRHQDFITTLLTFPLYPFIPHLLQTQRQIER